MLIKSKELEDKIIDFWRKEKIYEKVKAHREGAKKYYFLDGPPYATGNIHVGTAMNKVIKDCFIRFFRMRGFDTWDQPGYDTHGIPIENKVEKKLGFKNKKDIEEFGIEKFIDECKKFATQFIGVMNDQFHNLGVWMNWSNPYLTLNNDYIEGAWYTFKRAFEKGLLYRGNYSVHVCPRCETAVAYNEIEYTSVTDDSIFVKFAVKDKPNEYLVIWTTTPWTIPSNTGIMAKPDAEYARVKVGKDILIVAKSLVDMLMKKFGFEDHEVLETLKGAQLEGLKYEHPMYNLFPFMKDLKNAWRVVLSDQFVSLDEGTGLVHCAPGHGQEDYRVGIENKLPMVNPLGMDGTFNKKSGKFASIYAKDADKIIINELKSRDVLLHKEKITHEYPLCWRCDTPLLQMAVPQWFFRVTEIRDKLLEENEKVNWIPTWAGQRFKNWLESLGDWPISRQRYWGIPLPIWVCENERCGKIKVIGSRDELPKVPEDFHKPSMDKIVLKCEKCNGKMKRVPDVLDVWFDSGVAPWASLGYPQHKEIFEKMWPVDFVLEGPDQIRGWWNSLMITSLMTFERRPFDNVLFHGFVLDAHGAKMSKSRGNVVTTDEVIEKYGRDVLRFYYLSAPPWNDSYFKWDVVADIAKTFVVIKNTFNFVKTYVDSIPETSKALEMKNEDKWLLSRLNTLIKNCTDYFETFQTYKVAQEVNDFVLNELSRWYIKIIRNRVWPDYDGSDKLAAFYTLGTATDTSIKLLAPFCPFLTEHVHQNTILKLKKVPASVHMSDWPIADEKLIDEKLERSMRIVKEIVEAASAARQSAGIKLRWPVKRVVVLSDEEKVSEAVRKLNEVLIAMCNAKSVLLKTKKAKIVGDFEKAAFHAGIVLVDKKMTDVLKNEAMLREVVREVQNMRKENGFKVRERIKLTLASDDKTNKALKGFVDTLKKEVGASKVAIGKSVGKHKGELKFDKIKIEIAFSKI